MIYFWAQNDPGIGPLTPILNTPLVVAEMHMYTKTDAKCGNIFKKLTNTENFYYFGTQSGQKKLASVAHILHIFKITCNEHMKQYWC